MGIFDKWILARAERIKSEKEALDRAAREREHREWNTRREISNTAKRKLYEFIKKKAQEFDETVPCDLKVGDTAIINYYSLRKTGNNGWDGGPGSLLNNIPREEKTKPVLVKITKIYVDQSLADDLIDKFIENQEIENLIVGLQRGSLEKDYTNWISKRRGDRHQQAIGDLFGLYRTAHFDYEGSFKPKWGLNTDSFISDRFPEFHETFEVWQREINLRIEQVELEKQIAELNAKRKQIQEKYHNIRYESRD